MLSNLGPSYQFCRISACLSFKGDLAGTRLSGSNFVPSSKDLTLEIAVGGCLLACWVDPDMVVAEPDLEAEVPSLGRNPGTKTAASGTFLSRP